MTLDDPLSMNPLRADRETQFTASSCTAPGPLDAGPVLRRRSTCAPVRAKAMGHNSVAYIHPPPKRSRSRFADRHRYSVAIRISSMSNGVFLSADYAAARRKAIPLRSPRSE